jgi:hypothetical protein
MMPIYDIDPINWRDLQLKVSKIFSDSGFETGIEQKIETVRGHVNVDVLAARKIRATDEVHIAECKLWSKKVPKQVVHAFRTVVSDCGANVGYIVSKKGFQSGAYEAAEKSNVYLLTFEGFQLEFIGRWLDAVVDKVETIGYPLRRFTSPAETYFNKAIELLSNEDKAKHLALIGKYYSIARITNRTFYKDPNGQLNLNNIEHFTEKYKVEFPKSASINCLMDYFTNLIEITNQGVQEFDDFFGQQLRKR